MTYPHLREEAESLREIAALVKPTNAREANRLVAMARRMERRPKEVDELRRELRRARQAMEVARGILA